MHRACSLSLAVLLGLSCLPLSACGKEDTYTIGEWHKDILQVSGIQGHGDVTEDLIQYEVLCDSDFNEKAVLTREWEAFTLVNLYGADLSNVRIDPSFRESVYPYHMSAAFDMGLLNDKGIRPDDVVSRQQALLDLEAVVERANARSFSTSTKLEITEDLLDLSDAVESYDPDMLCLNLKQPVHLSNGASVQFMIDEEVYFGRVEKTVDEQTILLAPIPIEELFSSIDMQGGFDVDFEQAFITEEEEESDLSLTSGYVPNHSISLMSARAVPLVRSRTFNGYKVTYQVTSTQIKAEVSKESDGGITSFANVILNGLKPSYRWKMKDGKIEDAYFRCDFKTTENAGFRINDYKNLYGDLSSLDPNDLLSSVQTMFKQKSEMPVLDVPIATFTIPIPSAPMATIKVRLQLRLYSSARAELTFVQEHTVGMEIRNGSMRLIKDNTHESKALLKGNTSLMAGVKIGLQLARMSLMDITGEAGVKASLNTTMHIFDQDQTTTMTSQDIPADLLEEVYPNAQKALFCTDLKAYAVSDLSLNSSSTVAGKLGFSRTYHLLNESNGSIFSTPSIHLENGKAVKTCTRTGRTILSTSQPVSTERLQLDQYDLTLVPSQSVQVHITQLPEGYSEKDLTTQIKDTRTATCTGLMVTALQEGATILTVKTKDGKYEVSCMILVRKSSGA